jgi:hypothetical protein
MEVVLLADPTMPFLPSNPSSSKVAMAGKVIGNLHSHPDEPQRASSTG